MNYNLQIIKTHPVCSLIFCSYTTGRRKISKRARVYHNNTPPRLRLKNPENVENIENIRIFVWTETESV